MSNELHERFAGCIASASASFMQRIALDIKENNEMCNIVYDVHRVVYCISMLYSRSSYVNAAP